MANVKGTVNEGKTVTYKGQAYNAGEEVTFLKPEHADLFARNDLVTLDKEAEKKVDAALEKKEKKSNAGPGK
jgi:hypothetical protein